MASPRLSTTTALLGPVAVGAVLAALLLVLDVPVWAAVLIGLAGWGAGVLLVRNRARAGAGGATKQRAPRIDPFTLSDPWRRYVQRAQSSKLRFDRIVQGTKPGPMRDRLTDIGRQLDKGVEDCWRIASRGDEIDGALSNLKVSRTRNELAAAQAAGTTSESSASTIASLQAQLAAADRMQKVSDGTRDRLRLLDARMSEILTNATEVSVGATDDALLTDDVDGLLGELEALRTALEETDRVGRVELPEMPEAPAPPEPPELPEPPPPTPPTS
jgi:hypothetical protein